MQLPEAAVLEALDALRELHLVFETSGSRVTRYEHNFERAIGVPEQSAVLLGMLMLRGPQTAGELRINADRWHRFADISSVEGFLNELAERPADKGGPLVVLLPRAPGAREARWAHLLAGPIDVDAIQTEAAIAGTAGAGGQFDRISALEAEVATLRETVARLCAELGVSPAQPVPAGGHAKNDESPETN